MSPGMGLWELWAHRQSRQHGEEPPPAAGGRLKGLRALGLMRRGVYGLQGLRFGLRVWGSQFLGGPGKQACPYSPIATGNLLSLCANSRQSKNRALFLGRNHASRVLLRRSGQLRSQPVRACEESEVELERVKVLPTHDPHLLCCAALVVLTEIYQMPPQFALRVLEPSQGLVLGVPGCLRAAESGRAPASAALVQFSCPRIFGSVLPFFFVCLLVLLCVPSILG